MTVAVTTCPSLALVKYWGKAPGEPNVPATSSLAVGLEGLTTTTRLSFARSPGGAAPNGAAPTDQVTVDGEDQQIDRYGPLLDHFRNLRPDTPPIRIASRNSFPTAAGIASSSSGFAALAIGLDALLGTGLSRRELSRLARIGSGSAARAVFGGYTVLAAGADHADPYLPASHWPELSILVVVVSAGPKPIASRAAMEHARTTSPFWDRWLDLSEALFEEGCAALRARDLDELGAVMRRSYLAMFSTMFTSAPPVSYWLPESVRVQQLCEELRGEGVPAWETMDAGPQVKIVTTSEHVEEIRRRVGESLHGAAILSAAPGGEPSVVTEEQP